MQNQPATYTQVIDLIRFENASFLLTFFIVINRILVITVLRKLLLELLVEIKACNEEFSVNAGATQPQTKILNRVIINKFSKKFKVNLLRRTYLSKCV